MKKLDMRGFSHDVLLVAFVAIFAISGVAWLVASKAASCPPYYKLVSGNKCKLVTSASTKSATCKVVNVPTKVAQGQLLKPAVSILNTGHLPITPKFKTSFQSLNTERKTLARYSEKHTSEKIQPSKAVIYDMPQYLVTNNFAKGKYTITGASPKFSCAVTFTL